MKLFKKLRTFTTLVIMIALLLPTAVFAEENEFSFEQMAEIFEKLSDYHVSGVSESELSEAAIEAMLLTLKDPYTEYFTEEEWDAYESSLQQNYVGIGVQLNEDELGIFIEVVFPGSPAEAAGLKSGDYFAEVNGESMIGIEMSELISKVKGPEDTTVNITVKRDQEMIGFELTRKQIQLPVITSESFDGGVGYIQLTSFTDKAGELFAQELEALQEKESLNGLVVDLRNNPGGYLHAALKIAEQFIEDGVLMYTSDQNGDKEVIKIEDGESLSIPVVVLVNGNSASASEVLSGALQDYEIATILGEQTFGKGSVQNLLPLSDGGVLKVTTYEYLTPNQNKVNQVGITPDIEIENGAAQLIRGLYEAGEEQIEVIIEDDSWELNGVEFKTIIDVIEEDENKYVSSRILSAIIQGEINWNPELKAVEITTEETSATFPVVSEGLMNVNGTTYIDLSDFEKQFPNFNWRVNEDIITLDVD
ncbi:S41 family peptidase [Chengkuizengella sp. SCS-71B]|uniref:S41 family peptidase n=1 Tax=Chengkuizengella sp. SCS-71B TaxID=3115290 RepID=UPI0032C21ED0